jgi:hypothetical protein
MDETFELPVNYKNNELHFPAEFLRTGYSYKIQIDVYGKMIMFEPDEERNWRALVNLEDINTMKTETGLIEAIIESLNALG